MTLAIVVLSLFRLAPSGSLVCYGSPSIVLKSKNANTLEIARACKRHVAFMSHGDSVILCKSLKLLGTVWDSLRHEKRR
jgi:hypothetical protein